MSHITVNDVRAENWTAKRALEIASENRQREIAAIRARANDTTFKRIIRALAEIVR